MQNAHFKKVLAQFLGACKFGSG